MTTESEGGSPEFRAVLQQLTRRLAHLENRLDVLETQLHVETPPQSQPRAQAPMRLVPPVVKTEPAAPDLATLAARRAAGAPAESVPHPQPPVEIPAPPPPPAPKPELPPLVLPAQYRPTRAAAFVATHPATHPIPMRNTETIESQIGRQWVAWVGGLLVLAAVLFFLKLAWDAGWLRPSPTARVLMALAGGVALLALGQWMHAKKMGALAASLVGTGLAVLMATMFAANVAFTHPVLSTGAAFAGVIVVGAVGIAISLQMRMMALAVLALVGMYISPIILNTGEDKSRELLLYIGAVTATGLVVSFFKRNWWGLRGLAFAAGWIWLLTWCLGLARHHGDLGRLAVSAFFAMFLVEMAASLLRVMSPPKDPQAPDRPASPNTLLLETGAAVLLFANTTLAMSAFAMVYDAAGLEGLWMMALGLAGVMGIAIFVTPSRYFTISAIIQAMALVVLAVPLYFHHSAITFAWAILGLALAVYSYVTNSKLARIWMVMMLVLVTGRLFTFDAYYEYPNPPLFHIGSEGITQWMLMAWGAAVYALLLAWLGRWREVIAENGTTTPRGELWVTAMCTALGTLLWTVAAIAGLHSGNPLTLAEALWVLALIGFGVVTVKPEKALDVEATALVILILFNVKWAVNDGLALSIMGTGGFGDLSQAHSAPVMPILNLFVLNGVLLGAAIVLLRMLRSTGTAVRGWWLTALAFVLINVEVLKATDYWHSGQVDQWLVKNVVISVLWGLLGLTGVLVGFRRKIAQVRWVALVLLGFTVAKVLLVDMANVETFLRVLSFLALGIVLLVVSFVYHKVGAKMLIGKDDAQGLR